MDVFLSYPTAYRDFAEGLRNELTRSGLQVWSSNGVHPPETDWQRLIEEATRSSRNLLVIVGPQSGVDPAQQFTWQAVLQSIWQDPEKCLIPVLLRGAEPPPFVYSGSSKDEVQVIRVENPRSVRNTAQAVLEIIQGTPTRSVVSTVVYPDQEERQSRLSEIEQFAKSLKH
jgi:hypothetical protein